MAAVTLRNVNKVYGHGPQAVHAVRDMSLDIEDGEFVALLGPSGCGKTSTLRMLVGLETITSGDILLDGLRVNDLEPGLRNVAMAFETYALYPNFSVAGNLEFPLEVKGVAAPERGQKVQRIAELLRITDILEARPTELSGGQQQRVGLGRALIRDPEVFILDEVLSHIDAHLKFQMLFDLKTIHRELGKTMVYVTHDQVEALALADRVAVMSDAVLQQVGNRDALYHTPTNTFVADFIGEPPTNFFAVDLDADHTFATSTGLRFVASRARTERAAASGARQFSVGVRPQNLRVATADSSHTVTGDVVVDEYLGEQAILTLRAGDDEFRALVPPEYEAARGAPVTLAYSPDDVLVFERDSGRLVD